ncbi:uncharacterized protein BDR25DRAFT_349132 [Lindgomyces ingoldianus]|uniref:Uncharacterized protein n=1 Tax=Lindgomyces ingoldianus TaxID=673940 RepID=A0ACB6RD74_9PLEO|nr:uncharacterized protein BDR25DRAFT_349132 [Lindgomyces ingoldianus]KAF2477204.1 hypothetical protein BDR25DRAFT_349132 [Lindgomyces ingoldianus]
MPLLISLLRTGRPKRPLETDSQTIAPQVKRVKNEQPAYRIPLPNELVELIFLHLPPRSVISGSPRIQAMLHLHPISMNSNSTQKINPFLNRILPDLPVRGEKSTFKYFDRVSGSHPVKPVPYYATTEGENAIKQSHTDKNASWKRISLGTPGQPIRIRFVRAFEMPDESFSIEEWEVYCGEGLTIPEFQEIYEEHRATPWGQLEQPGQPRRSHRFAWEFLCEDGTLWMKFNTEEEESCLNKVKKRCRDINTAWAPLEDIDSDDRISKDKRELGSIIQVIQNGPSIPKGNILMSFGAPIEIEGRSQHRRSIWCAEPDLPDRTIDLKLYAPSYDHRFIGEIVLPHWEIPGLFGFAYRKTCLLIQLHHMSYLTSQGLLNPRSHFRFDASFNQEKVTRSASGCLDRNNRRRAKQITPSPQSNVVLFYSSKLPLK